MRSEFVLFVVRRRLFVETTEETTEETGLILNKTCAIIKRKQKRNKVRGSNREIEEHTENPKERQQQN